MPSVSGRPPTTAANAPPLPFSPWHIAHFSAKMRAPWAGVPLPGGKPVPSGWMLMSQAAISLGVIGLPRFGLLPDAALEPRANAQATAVLQTLCVNMLHLPLAVDRPARDAVVVLVRKRQDGWDLLRLAALRDERGAGRLHVPGLVPCAPGRSRVPTVPSPRYADPRESLGQHRLLQRSFAPAFAAVGRNHDLRDPPGARIGDAGDLVEARPPQRESGRRMGDEGFDLLQEVKAVRLPARQDLRVGPRLVIAHGRLFDQLNSAQELDVHVAFPPR